MKRFATFCLFLALLSAVSAQEFTPFYAGELEPTITPRRFFYQHMLELYGIGGKTRLIDARENALYSGGAGLQYIYFVHQCVGLGTGVQYLLYRNTYSSNGLITRATYTENADPLFPAEPYEHVTQYDFHEQTEMHSIEAPISLFFVSPDWNRMQFRSSLSFVTGWSIAEQYHLDGTYTRSIYYPDAFVNIDELSNGSLGEFPLGYNGVSSQNNMSLVGKDCQLSQYFALAAEIGFGVKLSPKVWLNLSAWGTYGFSDLHKEKESLYYANFKSILTTNQVGALYNAAVGLKLGFRFAFGRRRWDRDPQWDKRALFGFDQLQQNKINIRQPLPSGEEIFNPKEELEKKSSLITQLNLTGTYIDDGTSLSIEIPTIAARVQHAQIMSDIIIMFGFEKTEPTPTSKKLLRMLAEALRTNMPKKLLVRGHTCNLGKARTNMILGQKRADRVKELLIEYGIPADIIETSSAGQTEPKVPNTCEANRARNRRITMTYVY